MGVLRHMNQMDGVCEVQSDKSAVDISSPYSGKVLKFYHSVGDMIKVNDEFDIS